MNKMEIWDSVSKTDPNHTKKVDQRGGFTSIDAMYQVMRATEVFGPVGQGWGYDCVYSTLESGGQVLQFCDLTLWWADPKANRFGPIRGCNALVNNNGRLDDDAPKKALTDALTKGLSHLGFSADVFLGLFDDNKYVQQRRQEVKAEGKKDADMQWATNVVNKLKGITDPLIFEEKVTLVLELIEDKSDKAKSYIKDSITQQRGKLNGSDTVTE